MGDKGRRCVGLTTLPTSCADCLEIWEPQPSGTLRACPGIALPLLYGEKRICCIPLLYVGKSGNVYRYPSCSAPASRISAVDSWASVDVCIIICLVVVRTGQAEMNRLCLVRRAHKEAAGRLPASC